MPCGRWWLTKSSLTFSSLIQCPPRWLELCCLGVFVVFSFFLRWAHFEKINKVFGLPVWDVLPPRNKKTESRWTKMPPQPQSIEDISFPVFITLSPQQRSVVKQAGHWPMWTKTLPERGKTGRSLTYVKDDVSSREMLILVTCADRIETRGQWTFWVLYVKRH